ncbi:MAG: phosphatidate cytidylyltransferase [Bacteroidia bacterium]
MQNKLLIGTLLFFSFSMLESCAVVGGIFKAGVWVGILIVVAIIALIIYLITRGKSN